MTARVHEEIRVMEAVLHELCAGRLGRAVESELYVPALRKTVANLESKIDRVILPKPSLDPEVLWHKFEHAGFDLAVLNRREVQTLCTSPKTAMRPLLVEALARNPVVLKSFRTFGGFVTAYFDRWRAMAAPEDTETLIHSILDGREISRKSRVLDAWHTHRFLFSTEAARRMAERVVRERKTVSDVCSLYFVSGTSRLAAAAAEEAAILAVGKLIERPNLITEDEALDRFSWMSANLFGEAVSSKAFRAAMSELILSLLPDRFERFRTELVAIVHKDQRLGDPRLPDAAPNWLGMPQEARTRVTGWLARETLQFFFNTIVPRNDLNRRRAIFWLEYANQHGKIRDFQVAVSQDDRFRIIATGARTIPVYASTDAATSAFLMVFRGYDVDYVVVEFSESGNAAYVYPLRKFESRSLSLRSPSFQLRDLKRLSDAEFRIVHRTDTDWEAKARRQLAWLGIRP